MPPAAAEIVLASGKDGKVSGVLKKPGDVVKIRTTQGGKQIIMRSTQNKPQTPIVSKTMNQTLMGRTTVTCIPPKVNEIARPKQITTKISTDDDTATRYRHQIVPSGRSHLIP